MALARALVLALVAAVLAPGAGAQSPPAVDERPSVLLVLTDDQRWDTLWAMPTVEREVAGKGVTFENAFVVNPLCCPSRASILTGQYSHSTRVYTNKGRWGPYSFREGSTIAAWLQAAGYRTGFVGKYLNGYGGPRIPPGWSRWVAFSGVGFFNYTLNVDGALVPYVAGDDPAAVYATDVLADHAASFVEETTGPLFLVFAPYAPHEPALPAPRHENAFSSIEPWRPPSFNERDVSDKPAWLQSVPLMSRESEAALDEFRRKQLRSLLAVDDAVGRIVAALERTGRLSNTLVVFTSDNGFKWGEHRRESKMDPYEESIRVPYVVRYDRLVASPRDDPRLVLNIDLAPTFAELAGIGAPGAEGRSLLPLLSSPAAPWRNDFLVEHLRMSSEARIPTYCALRTERSTYVSYETGEEELYDLRTDPYQLTNRAADPFFGATLVPLRARLRRLCDPPPPVVCTMKGTNRSDFLRGTPGYEVVCAFGGNDVVHAGRGNDRVLAGPGHDEIYGNAGNDRLAGGPGIDSLFGGPGNDTIVARDGRRDFVSCWTGRDEVIADRLDRVTPGCEVVRRS